MRILMLVLFALIMMNEAKSQIYVGFGGGLDFAKVRYDDEQLNNYLKEFQKFQNGFNGGIYSILYFGKVLSLQSDLSFVQKGFKYVETYSWGYKKFNYAEFSTSGALDLNYEGDIKITPFIGYYAAYWLSGTRGFYDSKHNIFQVDKIYLNTDTTFAYNRWDLGIVAGCGFRYKPSKKSLISWGFRYEYGLLSSSKNKTDGWKNRNLLVFLSYNFKL